MPHLSIIASLPINTKLHMKRFLILFLFLFAQTTFAQTYTKFTNTSQVSSFTPANATRYQLIYNPTDFNIAPPTCVVDEISFRRNGGSGTGYINNLVIKMGCVDAASFAGNLFFQDLTTVFSSPSHYVNEGGVASIVDFDIDERFTYQQGKSLVVEISFSSATVSLQMRGSDQNKRLNGSLASQTGSSDFRWLDFGFTPKFEDIPSPPNDLCTNAQLLEFNTECQAIVGNSVGANQTLPPAFCGGFPSNAANDVYYRFTAATATDSILVKGLGGFDPVVQLLSGSCGSLNGVACSYTPGNAKPEKIAPGNLVPGQTYFIRVYGFNGVGGGFTICGRSGAPTAPVNDNCANSITLPISPVCASLAGTTAGATQEYAPIPCFGNTSSSANEVWYKFEAVNAYDSIMVYSDGFINPVVELYSGTCGALNTISCSDNATNSLAKEKVSPGTLVPGTTYYLRVYGFNETNGSFTICAQTPPGILPANDEPCEGITLVLNDDCQGQTYSNIGATQTYPPVACQPGGQSSAAADVWFKFDYSAIYDTVIVSPVGDFNPVVEMYRTSLSCLGINPVYCSDGVNPGAVERISTYGFIDNFVYVRVYGFNGTVGQFNICLRKGDPSVLYDQCADALSIEVSNTTCTPRRGRTKFATPTPGLAACKGNPDDDVWYKFDPFGAMNVAFRLTCDPGFDGAFQIFSGTCGSFTQLACVNRMGDGRQEDTLLSFTNNTEVYYIRVYHAGAGAGAGGFTLCANRVNAPANDNCSGAILLQGGASLCSPVAATNYAAAQANAPINCGSRTSIAANDVWFWFSATSSTMEINVQPVGGMDPIIQLYTGGCFGLIDRVCKDDSVAGQGERLIATNLLVGSNYYFRVYSYRQATAFGDFTVCVKNSTFCNTTPGTASSNVSNVVSNGRVILNLAGQTTGANVQWQVSTNGGANFNNLGIANAILPDTINVQSIVSQNYLYRAVVTATGCQPANSAAVTVAVRCATPFTNPVSASSGTYISNVSLHTLNQSSTPLWRNGGYENFTTTSVSLCKGQSYTLIFAHGPEGQSRTRIAWADWNNDGDFADMGEVILEPNTGIGAVNQSITIPNTAISGNVRLRLMVVDAGVGNPVSDPCFAGPYAAGEIEEYNLNLATLVAANAGTDKMVCTANSVLQGSASAPGTGLWTLISGSATIQNPTQANATLQNIGTIPILLEWRVTNGGCISQDTVSFVREASPDLLPDDSTICQGDTITLPSPIGFVNFLWYNGNGGPFQQILSAGNFWVQVTTFNGCTFRDTLVVTLVPCTQVLQKPAAMDLHLVPNPARNQLQIVGLNQFTKVHILNAEGRLTESHHTNGLVSITSLPPGFYIVHIPEIGIRLRFVKE